MSTIESSVTRLLVSTKHLLESLTQWARQKADDKFVSDAYVKLGNDFRAASRAFTNAGVDISDLGDVPKALRIVLESALSEAPTQENLDRFLPNIRNIIVNLLLNLKAKQSKAKELSDESMKESDVRSPMKSSGAPATNHRGSDSSETLARRKSRPQSIHPFQSNTGNDNSDSVQLLGEPNDALAKLQKGNFILRRASKRFSAYQFAKLTSINNSQLSRLAGDVTKTPDTSFDERPERPNAATPSTLATHNEVPQSADSITIFMRVGEVTKKVAMQLPVTMASLRLQFVEKFAYSPKSAVFPDIYVLDSQSGVWYELEDMCVEENVKRGSLLTLQDLPENTTKVNSQELNSETLENKLHEFASQIIEEVKSIVSSMEVKIPVAQPDSINEAGRKGIQPKDDKLFIEIVRELQEIQSQLQLKGKSLQNSVEQLVSEVERLKEAGLQGGEESSNRSYMQQSYSKLSEDSDNLLTRVDDLQDMMEALRKDVAQRGVRLDPKQLKNTRKEIEDAKQLLLELNGYIDGGKPTWKKIWEAELDKVCEEQQFFNLQDDLTSDLEEDIKKLQETFDLIEKCSLEQSKQTQARKAPFPSLLRLQEPGENLHNLRDAIMSEVSALVPDHQNRLEAIAKAERLRQKEREFLAISQFQEELGDYVEDKKFKTSGGIEDLERRRQEKDWENLKLSLGAL